MIRRKKQDRREGERGKNPNLPHPLILQKGGRNRREQLSSGGLVFRSEEAIFSSFTLLEEEKGSREVCVFCSGVQRKEKEGGGDSAASYSPGEARRLGGKERRRPGGKAELRRRCGKGEQDVRRRMTREAIRGVRKQVSEQQMNLFLSDRCPV